MKKDNLKYVYIHCLTHHEFNEYIKSLPPTHKGVRILDGNTLRGRVSGLVVRYGRHYEKWNAQEIEESIAIHEELWQKESTSNLSEQDKKILDYGID